MLFASNKVWNIGELINRNPHTIFDSSVRFLSNGINEFQKINKKKFLSFLQTVVLNSNNFDFLLSRGTNQVNAEDGPRSSLLLSFDPLTRRSLYAKQTKPLVVDEPIPETSTSEPSASFDRTHFGVNEVSSANGNLVNAMDDDGNSFVNNVRSVELCSEFGTVD